jgi:hypothetical protein
VLCAFASAAALGAPKSTINRYAPTISGTPSTTVNVGSTYAFTPVGYDADGQKLTYSASSTPAWATFNRRTGTLSGTPTVADTSAPIVISVTDGYYTASLPAFTITALGATPTPPPPPPPPVQPPTISGTPSTTARVGLAYSFQPSAQDPQGRTLTYTIVNRPTWAAFDAATGRLAGTPAAADVGTYANIVIGADNGSLCSTLAPFGIDVQAWSNGSATLSWDPPTLRTDGTALVNLAGYKVHYGTSPGAYTVHLTISTPGITAAMIENLPPGTYYFTVTAYDADGLESGYSGEASKTIS